jgi:Glycosyltransferase family 87
MSVDSNDPAGQHTNQKSFSLSPQALAIFALLVVSLASLRTIPFASPWGLDLQNLHLYQRCAAGRSPYEVPGVLCGDPFGRGMYYPPLLFHSFAWTRSLSLGRAMQVWSIAQLLAFAGVLYAWARRICGVRVGASSAPECVVFGALLLPQFPMAFALERGGSDVWAVVLATVAALLFTRQHHLLAGAALGVASAYKLYPVFTCAVVVLGLMFADWSQPLRARARWRFIEVGAASVAAFGLVSLIFYSESKVYFTEVLPKFAGTALYPGTIGHSLTALNGAYPRFTGMVIGSLVLLWAWAAGRAFARTDFASGVAGALAISTYTQSMSWDYNLVTTYPLLLVMFLRARVDERWGVLGLGLVAIVGERDLYGVAGNTLFTPHLHIMLQLAFLVLSALVVAGGDPVERGREARAS